MDLNLTLKNLINDTIAPLLKSMGFKKNGNNFYREIGEIGQCVNVQQSRWNSVESKEFTINVGLLHKGILKTHLNKEIPKFPKEYDCLVSTRLSHLKIKGDHWYELNTNTAFKAIANEINNDVISYLIPFLIQYDQFNNWIDLVTNSNNIIVSDITKFYILTELGQLNDACKIIIKPL
ncbi:DUF4304 domain-containing protein [Sphingobacterium lactis]|uniref:DUF4304 domain-containing protein n=1 Tax=Sphingobacterium lactis TaxID=797291 RepID=UPI003F7ECF02